MSSSDIDSRRGKGSKIKRSLFPLVILFAVLLMIASGVLIYLVREHVEASSGYDKTAYEMMASGFSCEYSEAQKLYPFGEGVLKVTQTRVAYLSMTGAEVYGADIDMENPFCVVNTEYALVADAGGYFCALFDTSGKVFTYQMDGAIRFGTVGTDGTTAYILEKSDTKGTLYLLDKNSVFISEWRSVESGYPLSACFAPDQSSVYIALADTDGGVIRPHMKEIGLSVQDGAYAARDLSIYSPESTDILSVIAAIGDDTLYAAGISDLFVFSGGASQAISTPFGQILQILPAGNRLAVFYSEGIEQEICLELIGTDMKRQTPLVIGNDLSAVIANDKVIVAASDNSLIFINTSTNAILKTIEVNQEIIRIGFQEDGTVVVVTADGVREIAS